MNNGSNVMARMLLSLMSMCRLGPAVSLRESPIVWRVVLLIRLLSLPLHLHNVPQHKDMELQPES